MSTKPTTEHEYRVHALNIHGTFFERLCQHIVAHSQGWNVKSANYPVEFPPSNGPFPGQASALDIWAEFKIGDNILTLPIECKKHNPELSNWIFFQDRRTELFFNGGAPSITEIENIPRQAPGSGWEAQVAKKGWSGITYVCTDEAREVRSSYLEYKKKNLDQLTKTASNSIGGACYQIALATHALINEQNLFSTALGNYQNPPPPMPYKRQVFLPVIVTTAKLFYCSFDASDVDVATGEIAYDKVVIKELPYLLYEYPVPRILQHRPKELAQVLAANMYEQFVRMDILVVNSCAFTDILSKLAATFSQDDQRQQELPG